MIRINLLPVRLARKKENAKKQLSVYVLSILFTVLVMSYLGISFSGRVTSLAAELQKVQNDTNKYTKIVRELEQEKKQKEKIQEKLGLIKLLQNAKTGPVHLLDEICANLPAKKLSLNAMKQDDKGLNLKGIALDNETVAQYMKNLSHSPYLTNVELVNSEQLVVNGKKLMQFSVNCQMKAPQTGGK